MAQIIISIVLLVAMLALDMFRNLFGKLGISFVIISLTASLINKFIIAAAFLPVVNIATLVIAILLFVTCIIIRIFRKPY